MSNDERATMSNTTEAHKEANDKHNLAGLRVLVVGGSQGLGSGVATVLAKRGASLVIASRSEVIGQESAKSLAALSPNNASVTFKQVDLGQIADVKRFASEISNEKFDHIVWTAGYLHYGPRLETVDGIEKCFAIDYLARFIGLNLLLPTLKKDGRVLAVYAPFSPMFFNKFKYQIDFEDFQIKKEGRYEQGEFENRNITVTAFNDLLVNSLAKKHPQHVFLHQQPGYVRSDLYKNSDIPKDNNLHLTFGVDKEVLKSMVPKEQSDYGETAVYLLTEPSVASLSGRGIQPDGTPYEDNEFIQNPEYGEKLWNYSANLAGL